MKNSNIESVYGRIGQRIREIREKQNPHLSQERLAKLISMSRTSVVNIEQGYQRVMIHTLYDIAGVLKVELNKILPKPENSNELKIISRDDLDEKKRKKINDILSKHDMVGS